MPLGVHLSGDDGDRAGKRPARTEAKASGPLDADEAIRRAKETGEDVEVTAEHTADSTTWAQPDGLLRTRIYSDTIRAKGDDGKWTEIDTTLRRTERGWSATAVNDPVTFSAGTAEGTAEGSAAGAAAGSAAGGERASRGGVVRASLTSLTAPAAAASPAGPADSPVWSELVRLNTGGHDVVVSWPGPLPEPVVEGPRALYPSVRPGIDLLLTARDSGYSHLLIVHTKEAAADPLLDELAYRLSSPGLTFRLDEESSVVSAVDESGEELAAAPTPYAWDSAGKPAVTEGEPARAPSAVHDSFNLPGLAGPQPGTHDAVLTAELQQDDILSLGAPTSLLTGADTAFPVFIDPSFKGHKKNWTLLYAKHASSSFWNGQNYNDGTNEARIGYESTTGGLSRSVFTFDTSDSRMQGATITDAKFRALQTYSWGCAKRRYNLYLTGSISSSNTWNKQPYWGRFLDEETSGHGYKSGSCPDSWVALDIKSAAQEAADKGWKTLTLGLRAASESDANYWKKIQANGENSPYVEISLNRKPHRPANLSMTPGPGCDLTSPYGVVGKSDLTFRAKGYDPDGNLKSLRWSLWPSGDWANRIQLPDSPVNSDGYAAVEVPWTKFAHGKTYSWMVLSLDAEGAASALSPGGGEPCRFTVDQVEPPAPVVSSAEFPEADEGDSIWSTVRFGQSGTFAVTGGGSDTVRYEYSINTNHFHLSATASAGEAVLSVQPPQSGPNVLYIRGVDSGGNLSLQSAYRFNVLPRTGVDAPGDTTGDGQPDLLAVTGTGRLMAYAGDDGDIHHGLDASYSTETGNAVPTPDGYWTDALITHHGDWFHGDGVQDLVARMKDGELYVYPGDGYGSFDVSKRQRILLPPNAPASSGLTQILSVGDVDGDGLPDLFATYGAQLWIVSGYSGGSFAAAHKMTDSAWDGRDLVLVGDVTGDGTADMVYRVHSEGKLYLREGKPDADGSGTDILSLGLASTSRTGSDAVYGSSGWGPTSIPLIAGTPDVDGDSIPDFWTLFSDGKVYLYPGGPSWHGTRRLVISGDTAEGTNWSRPVALG
ncbi:DNRLRE domain-containing protein [Streptomyces sp. PR69]|uniref:DNRLRE domain-containing protein n=1 Tax=Streptomyces sp. PR69 TaxID=2984950 RepID=UPI002263BCDC|nr:DNRLRE domain-containing protein [Streptomyces sp. PR69]